MLRKVSLRTSAALLPNLGRAGKCRYRPLVLGPVLAGAGAAYRDAMATGPRAAGQRVRVAMTKWGARPHWEFEATYLGSDRHGDWLGIPAGTLMTRPGADYVSPTDQVGLVPAPGSDPARGFLATFHAPGGPVRLYVDMTTPPRWDGLVVRAVDLDLDVVRGLDGAVWVDDEDEFAEHRVRWGYPDDVVVLATATRDRVLALAASETAPFDTATAEPWLDVLRWAGDHRVP